MYDASLEILLEMEKGEEPVKVVMDLNKPSEKISVPLRKRPIKVILDPMANLLFEGKIEN